MAVTRVFRNGNSQAVRIPAELAFDRSDLDVEIERVGDELRIRPLGRSLDGVLEKFARVLRRLHGRRSRRERRV